MKFQVARLTLISIVFLFACNAQAQMAVDFEWRLEHRCSTVSPALTISGAPSGTTKFLANMVDNDFTTFVHGGGAVEASNPTDFEIPSGALKSYKGPCPPNFFNFGHDYIWTVQAVDSAGKVLAIATKTKTFSSAKVPK